MLPRHLVRHLRTDGWVVSHPANRGAPTEHASPAQTIVVLSAPTAARWSPSSGTAVISIRGTRDAILPLAPQYRAILRLAFDDTSPLAAPGPEAVPLSAAQADAVAEFVAAHARADTLLLHCHAGVSRSRSMAAAICEVRGLPYRWTVVNEEVYQTVRAALLARRDDLRVDDDTDAGDGTLTSLHDSRTTATADHARWRRGC